MSDPSALTSEALAAIGKAQSPADLAPQIFPNAREHHLYLTLSEVMGNLEVLESRGRIARKERAGRIVFEAV